MCQNENPRSLMITRGIKLQGISDCISACLKDCRLTVSFPRSVLGAVINPKNWDSIFESVISGTLENQESISLKIAVTGCKLDSNNLDTIGVECIVSEIKTGELVIDGERNNKQWLVRLSNVKIERGDLSTVVPIPAGISLSDEQKTAATDIIALYRLSFPTADTTNTSINEGNIPHSFRWNKITFNWDSRDWNLTDDKLGEWSTDLDAITLPVISGSLVAAYQHGDTEDRILDSARDIALLLSFALQRDIQPCSIALENDIGTIYTHELCPYVRPFNNLGIASIIDNGNAQWGGGNLKKFLESFEPVFNTDKAWWTITIAWFVNAAFQKVVDIKVALLNVLLERTSRYVINDNTKYKDKDHPSFDNAVQSACEKLGVQSISQSSKFRNAILHQGDLSNELPSFEERVKYSLQLDAIITLLILRKIDFNGNVLLK